MLYAPRSAMPVAALTFNHKCPFKYRTRESELEQVPIYTLHGGKNEKENKNVNKLQNSFKIVFRLRSIHGVEKKHIRKVKNHWNV